MPIWTKSLLASPQLWRVALCVYWVAMFVGTHIPAKIPHLSGGVLDKFVHLAAFAGLAVLFATNWQLFGGQLTFRHYLITVLVLGTYAMIDEFLQIFVNRDCSLADWVSDVAGVILGLFIFHQVRKRLQQSADQARHQTG